MQPGDHGEFIQSTVLEQVEQFFHPESITAGTHFEYLGVRTNEGTEYDLVEPKDSSTSEETVDYFISRSDKLIHRSMLKEMPGKQPDTWTDLKNVRTNHNLDPSLFSWKLPRTAKSVQLPVGIQLPLK
jgi:outer membrane lipoprotein-sorting protein